MLLMSCIYNNGNLSSSGLILSCRLSRIFGSEFYLVAHANLILKCRYHCPSILSLSFNLWWQSGRLLSILGVSLSIQRDRGENCPHVYPAEEEDVPAGHPSRLLYIFTLTHPSSSSSRRWSAMARNVHTDGIEGRWGFLQYYVPVCLH